MKKIIAFYLPQFHPINENNKWWEKGFTEWTNVVKSKPRFLGHHQPQLPSELGYYDLRVSDTREEQARLAMQYGISGFCYYHYWFNGHMLLERPLKEVLELKKPDFPFCMCWANENWTRAWDGLEREILIKQDYTEQDSKAHFEMLLPYFRDERYIKISGAPLFVIYRLDNIPNVSEYFSQWQDWAKAHGFPKIYLVAAKNGFVELMDEEIISQGFDAIVDFQPDRRDFPDKKTSSQFYVDIARRILPNSIYQALKNNVSAVNIINYQAMVKKIMSYNWPRKYIKYPCVFPSWDNSARRKTPTVIQNDNPDYYEKWLSHALSCVQHYPEMEQFVFINAWNEWAEGCHLEPDQKNGRSFLDKTLSAVENNK